MLVPAATLGLMAATAEAATGKFPMPTVLISAFRAGRQRPARCWCWAWSTPPARCWPPGSDRWWAIPRRAPSGEPRLDISMLVTLLLHTPLFLMFWHAPALVHWHGVTPAKSLFFSTVACWRNMGALLVYGLAWMGVFLRWASCSRCSGHALGGATAARAVIMMPAALLMAAMFSTSIWFTFRDSFAADDPTPDPAPASTDGDTP
jgi:hypothetical protein